MMKKLELRNIFFGMIPIYLFPILLFGEDNPVRNPLSVEDTLGSAFIRLGHGHPWNLYKTANKEAKQPLYKILEDKESAAFHPAIIRILGYIGTDSDAVKLEQMVLKDFSGVLSDDKGKALYAIFEALGLMCGSGSKEAENALIRMAAPEYWANAQFRWYPDSIKTVPPFEFDTIGRMIQGSALSENNQLYSIVSSLIESIEDKKLNEHMKWMTNKKLLSEIVENIRAVEAKPVSAEDRMRMTDTYKQYVFPLLERNALNADERAFVFEMIKQTKKEFEKICALTRDEDYKAVATRLLDNGKPINFRHARIDEIVKDLATQKQALVASTEAKASPGDFQVERDSRYAILGSGEDEKELKAKKDEVVTVQWHLKGSHEIGNVLFQNSKGKVNSSQGCLTVAEDGTLIVVMKKIGDQWYWNPFGW